MGRPSRLIVLVLSGLLLLIGCGPTATVPMATPAAPIFPSGDFAVMITDLSGTGAWVLTFTRKDDSGGAFAVKVDGSPIGSGSYALTGNQIVITENSSVCRGKGDGSYTWVVDGPKLSFTKQSDACPNRFAVLDGRTFTAKE